MAELFPFRCDNCKQCLHFSTNLEFHNNHEKDCRKKRNSELQKDRRSIDSHVAILAGTCTTSLLTRACYTIPEKNYYWCNVTTCLPSIRNDSHVPIPIILT